MKKIHAIGLALIAVFAFAAFTASSAFAVSEFLAGGAVINTALATETTGLLFLTTLVLGISAVKIDCQGIFDGTVELGIGTVTELLNTAKEKIGGSENLPLVAPALSCTVETSLNSECGAVGSLAELWAENLSWALKIELMEAGANEFLIDFPTTSAYEVKCANGKENLCEGLSSARLTNGATDVIGLFSAAAGSESTVCTTGSGDIEGEGLTTLNNGESLQVS